MADPVEKFLRSRECPVHIVKGGLPGLVDNWERTVHEVAGAKIRGKLPERVAMADALLKKVAVPAPGVSGEMRLRERADGPQKRIGGTSWRRSRPVPNFSLI